MRTVRTPLYRTLWSLSILLPLMMVPVSTTTAEDPKGGGRPAPSSPAPKGYRDFTLGMTRRPTQEIAEKLGARENNDGSITVPRYEQVQNLRLFFTDGLGFFPASRHAGDALLYGDAKLYKIVVDFTRFPRPATEFVDSYKKAFGGPARVKPFITQSDAEFNIYGDLRDLSYGPEWNLPFEDDYERHPHDVSSRIDNRYEWRWLRQDVGAWLYSTVGIIDSGDYFQPRLVIEHGAHSFHREKKRYLQEWRNRRSAIADDLAAGTFGEAPHPLSPSPAAHIGTFLGVPVRSQKIFCLTGPSVWTVDTSHTGPLDQRADAVIWREFRAFFWNLPPAVAIPDIARWKDVYERPKLPHFLPATIRTKAENLGALRESSLAGVIVATQTLSSPRGDVAIATPTIQLSEQPLFVLDRILKTDPDTVICVVHSRDFPVTIDALLAWSLGKASLPQFEIVEIASAQKKPRPHPGLEALAKVSGGRYRIWVAADQPLVTVVDTSD